MKTNLEKNIKEQIERRKLEVSDNAWDKLTQMMDEKPSSEKGRGGESSFAKRKLWIPVSVAASILFFFTIYLLNSNENEESIHPANQNTEIVTNQTTVEELNENTTSETMEIVETKKEVFIHQKTELNTEKTNSKEILVKSEERKVSPKPVELSPILEQIIENTMENPKMKEQKTELALQPKLDSESNQKKNYVDPEMLLYSIENNQAVKQNNSDSRMVIIDFNK